MNRKSLGAASAFAFFLLLAVGSSDDRTPEEKAAANCEDTTMAFVMSQEFLKERLKSPASAEFPYTSSQGVKIDYLGDCRHRVLAYVDAQNTFGAMLRMKYSAELQYQKDSDLWRLLDIQLLE